MDFLLGVLVLFAFGSLVGWVIELLFRRYFSSHKWINPGFLVGPYLPLYGFGVALLFAISYFIDFSAWFGLPSWLNALVVIVLMSLCMTMIEYIAGIIFIKGMHIKLWDYSGMWGNIQGIICPLFSFFWSVIAAAFYFLLKTPCAELVLWFEQKSTVNTYLMFALGMFYGMMLVDFCYSMHVATKIKQFATEHQVVIKYEKFKESVRELQLRSKEKISFVFPLLSTKPLKEHLLNHLNAIKNKEDK